METSAKGWVSQSEAARREGVTHQWVSKLVRQGRLDTNSRRQVRAAQVRRVRREEIDPARGRHKRQANQKLLAIRTLAEKQKAIRAEIELRLYKGELVDWSTIEALNASTAVMLRESLMAIPDRLAAVIAAEGSPAAVRALLDKEILQALTALNALERATCRK